VRFWLQFTLILLLALAAWISAIDTNGSAAETYWLSLATLLASAHLLFRLLRSAA
jgi:hypothetical protein